ncbi:MAG: hypothetical protein ACSHX7_03565 [Luteolibacter sp.]
MNMDGPKLTAYVLRELPEHEADKVRAASEKNAALRGEIDQLGVVCDALDDALAGGDAKLSPSQRSKIMRAAKEAGRNGKVERLASHRKAKRMSFWTLPLAAAAAVVGGIFLVMLFPSDRAGGGSKAVTTSVGNDVGNGDGLVVRKNGDFTQLPLSAGNQSLAEVLRSIRTDGKLPSEDEVRIGEILNAFPLRAKDSVALWKGCTLGVEILACPWRPSSSLVMVDLRGDRKKEAEVGVRFVPAGDSIISHRVIGYEESVVSGGVSENTMLPAGGGAFLVLEVETRDMEIGTLEWSVHSEPGPPVQLVRDVENEPSDDGRFAALVCIYGLWLKQGADGLIDESMVLGMAREVAAESMVPDRYDFLSLVDETMKISGE